MFLLPEVFAFLIAEVPGGHGDVSVGGNEVDRNSGFCLSQTQVFLTDVDTISERHGSAFIFAF